MDTSTIVMMVAAVITLMVVHWQSPEAAGKGLGAAGALILEIMRARLGKAPRLSER